MRSKVCKICGKKFSVDGCQDNPYKWCLRCRRRQYKIFGLMAKGVFVK